MQRWPMLPRKTNRSRAYSTRVSGRVPDSFLPLAASRRYGTLLDYVTVRDFAVPVGYDSNRVKGRTTRLESYPTADLGNSGAWRALEPSGATLHGRNQPTARGAGPRLADRHARRRKMPRSPVPPLAARPALHAAAPAKDGCRRHRATLDPHQFPASPAPSSPLLSLSIALDAGSSHELAR